MSKLEKLNKKLLKKIIEFLYKFLSEEGIENPVRNNLGDYEVFNIVEKTFKILGLGDPDYDDIDFIFSTYMLNFDNIKKGKIENDLILPTISTYSYEIDVFERISQRVTYQHTYESYSEKNVFPLAKKAEEEGYFSVWDGNQIDSDIFDSETEDIRWDYSTLRKIK